MRGISELQKCGKKVCADAARGEADWAGSTIAGARGGRVGARRERAGARSGCFRCEPRRRLETIRAGGLTPCSYCRFTHTLRGSRLLQLPNRNRGRDNGNPLNMFEGKHIGLILGNNHIDLTGNSGSQDRVVLWVRRHIYIWQIGCEHCGCLQKFKKLFNISKRDA